MEETWRQMDGHPKFLVSNLGRISNRDGKIFSTWINHEGYEQVCLCEKGKKFVVKVHKEVANKNGVGVMFYKTANENGKCYATDAMFDVFSKVVESTFSDILDVIMESWDGEKASLQSGFLKGLGKFYELYNGKFTKKALIDCMKTRNPEWFIREAKNIQSGNLATRYCKAFLKAYNMRKSVNKLPDVV